MHNFSELVPKAQAGDREPMNCIIEKFINKIAKHSKDNMGRVDEDYMQYIICYLIEAIGKFRFKE